MSLIFLILSSSHIYEDNVYKGKQIFYNDLKIYQQKNFEKYPEIKYFFIEYKENLQNAIEECDNYIFIKGKETMNPGMIEKTLAAIEYINNKYKYDYLVRTNLSSIFNLQNMLNLATKLPQENVFSGVVRRIDKQYISGTCIIMTKDVTTVLTSQYKNFIQYSSTTSEDILISLIINKNNIPLIELHNYFSQPLYMANMGKKIKIPPVSNDILYYRFLFKNNYLFRLQKLIEKIK